MVLPETPQAPSLVASSASYFPAIPKASNARLNRMFAALGYARKNKHIYANILYLLSDTSSSVKASSMPPFLAFPFAFCDIQKPQVSQYFLRAHYLGIPSHFHCTVLPSNSHYQPGNSTVTYPSQAGAETYSKRSESSMQ